MGYTFLALKGIGWMGSLQGIFRLLTLLKFIIIARLLDPSQVGLFGLVMLSVSFFESVSDFGLSLYLVQTAKLETTVINAIWTVSIIRGLILSILLFLVAYPLSVFFNVADNISLFLIASTIPFIKSFVNPSVAKFQKNLLFQKEFTYRSLIIVIEVVSSIIFVLFLKSPIALVYSLIFSGVIEVILSLLFIRPIPHFVIEKEKIREIINFGKWISMIGTTNFFANQLDSILVGRFIGADGLGIYQMAQRFSLKILSEAGDVVARVLFPVFAQIKSDTKRLRNAFLKTIILVGIVFGAFAILLFLYSPEFILLTIGQKWLTAEEPIKIFAILGFLSVIMSLITSLFLAVGKQDITAKLIVFRLFFLIVLLLIQQDKLTVVSLSFISLISFFAMFPFALYSLRNVFKIKRSSV